MTRRLLAAALAKGVEAAAQLEFSEAKRMLENNDAIVGDVFADTNSKPSSSVAASGKFARWRVDAIQELSDEKGPCIELSVNSSDGTHEFGVHFYVRRALAQST